MSSGIALTGEWVVLCENVDKSLPLHLASKIHHQLPCPNFYACIFFCVSLMTSRPLDDIGVHLVPSSAMAQFCCKPSLQMWFIAADDVSRQQDGTNHPLEELHPLGLNFRTSTCPEPIRHAPIFLAVIGLFLSQTSFGIGSGIIGMKGTQPCME